MAITVDLGRKATKQTNIVTFPDHTLVLLQFCVDFRFKSFVILLFVWPL